MLDSLLWVEVAGGKFGKLTLSAARLIIYAA